MKDSAPRPKWPRPDQKSHVETQKVWLVSRDTLLANESMVLEKLAEASHETWRMQRSRDKEIDINTIPTEVSKSDQERARLSFNVILNHPGAGRDILKLLLSISSHNYWVEGEKERIKKECMEQKLGHKEILKRLQSINKSPNKHDEERAEADLKAIESLGLAKA